MERIFISSLARGEMGAIREAARRAVEALDMHPVMFETGAASGEASRRALLDRVASCDALILLLGAEYGQAGDRGMSPTEEEFDEATERGVPVLALVQDTTREPAQEDFLWRVRGDWEKGRLTADFTDASDVGFAVTKALNAWRRQREGGDAAPAAEAWASTRRRPLAMREVEIRVRDLAGAGNDDLGVALMKEAFKQAGPLADPALETGEQQAAMALLWGAIGVFKNPSSHRQVDYEDPTLASEIILFADLLHRMLDRVEARRQGQHARPARR